jgi:predicted outer membrane repeat protein
MFTTLRSWFAPKSRTIRQRSAPKARLRLERLEDRATPASFTVTNLNSDAAVEDSLPWAVAQANGIGRASTITIDPSLTGPIVLESGLQLQADITVTATGSFNIARDTNAGQFGVIAVAEGTICTLSNLSITGGDSPDTGGGIYNQGTLTVDNCRIRYNKAQDYGGGIYNGGTLTVSQSYVTNNQSDVGGGIRSDPFTTCTLSDSSIISWNQANSYGGGMSIGAEATVTATDTNFQYNQAPTGGGLHVANTATFSLDGGGFEYNRATTGNGGGIWTDAQISISDALITLTTLPATAEAST